MKPKLYLPKRTIPTVKSELELNLNLKGKLAYFILNLAGGKNKIIRKKIGLMVTSRNKYKSSRMKEP